MEDEKNYARERISEDMSPFFPSKNIKCRTCIHKKPGIIGYKNAYCDMYEKGKPNDILFKNADCPLYVEESIA